MQWNISRAYQNYTDVLSEQQLKELLKHGSEDLFIELETGGQPLFGPLYSLLAIELQVLRDYLDENLAKGFFQPSLSPGGAPVLFVKKKNGSLKLCVNYRSLNRIIVKNPYPLPLIREAMHRLVSGKWYTKLDIRDPYHMIRIREGNE